MSDFFAPAVSDHEAAQNAERSTERATARTAEPTRPDVRIPLGLRRFAGASLLAFPPLFSAGMVFSPLQTEPGEAGYIASLAADPFTSMLSANLLHHSWVFLALGVMGLVALTARRGRTWVSIAAAVVAFGAVQMSGLLLSDWFLIAAGNSFSSEEAVAFDAMAKDASLMPWFLSAQLFTMIGLPVLSLGLARARVVSWWIAPLPLLAFAVPMLNLGAVAALAFVPLMAPFIIAGVKLIRQR